MAVLRSFVVFKAEDMRLRNNWSAADWAGRKTHDAVIAHCNAMHARVCLYNTTGTEGIL